MVFPEFDIRNKHELIPRMVSLGLVNIFDESYPAFTHIATSILYASKFEQEAEITVDKEGTVAKAVTEMCMDCLNSMESTKEVLEFNRPFYYFLRNINSGDIIFMGRVNKLDDCKHEDSNTNKRNMNKVEHRCSNEPNGWISLLSKYTEEGKIKEIPDMGVATLYGMPSRVFNNNIFNDEYYHKEQDSKLCNYCKGKIKPLSEIVNAR